MIKILKISTDVRKKEEIKNLGLYFREVKFFKSLIEKYGDYAIEPCFKELEYSFKGKEKRVMRFLDKGQKFFIVLKGEVSVHIPILETVTLEQGDYVKFLWLRDNFGTYVSQSKTYFPDSVDSAMTGVLKEVAIDDYTITYEYFKMTEVSVIKEGGSFGEQALLNEKPRAATIICTKDSHFATFNKFNYQRIIGKLMMKSKNE